MTVRVSERAENGQPLRQKSVDTESRRWQLHVYRHQAHTYPMLSRVREISPHRKHEGRNAYRLCVIDIDKLIVVSMISFWILP